ncbi:MAG TPA: excisionase family DNA-binding protein [Gemmataceae bacterium]|nr:excisionase family DNA-binding protein [Gemmataceae bacterium]
MSTQVSDFSEGVVPTAAEARLAQESLQHLKRALESHQAELRLCVRDDAGETIVLPIPAVRLLKDILSEMAKGNGVTLLPLQAELTTQQAADLLNVSRPYLIGLLEEKKIPYRLVGKHRRIRLEDVLAYKQRDDRERLKVLGELVAQAQELNMGY